MACFALLVVHIGFKPMAYGLLGSIYIDPLGEVGSVGI
jgi:hypothetical protein